MKCLVCSATWPDQQGASCPRCHHDHAAPHVRELPALNAARARFRDEITAYAPDKRVSLWDNWRPWAGVALGFFTFVMWLRACSTGGFRLW
jgi:hypothetical protein